MTLIRKETKKGHSYTLDGRPVKGVTTLISGGVPKPQLMYWSAKQVAEFVADNPDAVETMRATMGRESMVSALKSVPWDRRDEAATRGTDVHALAEQIIHGEAVVAAPHLTPYLEGYVKFLDAFQIEPIITERPCASRKWWYAGTFDAVLQVGRGQLAGMRILADWKTSRSVYGDTSMQLAAYQNADFYLGDDGEECPMPDVDVLAVVHVTPTGTDMYVVRDPASAWTTFQHAQFVAKRLDDIKSQIGDPTPMPEEE